MAKVFVLLNDNELFYLKEIYYSDYNDRYNKLKGIDPKNIFEESEIDRALKKLSDLNSI